MAEQAKTPLVGYSEEQVLACAGPPTAKAAEGKTEVWSYDSGGGHVDYGYGESERRFCKVDLTMNASRVARVDYLGPSSDIFTPNEQCEYALEASAAR